MQRFLVNFLKYLIVPLYYLFTLAQSETINQFEKNLFESPFDFWDVMLGFGLWFYLFFIVFHVGGYVEKGKAHNTIDKF